VNVVVEKVGNSFQANIKHNQIDILLNNAGLGYFGMLRTMSIEQMGQKCMKQM
jgi:short-subunit dehydrogenase